jgi:hypothetical protein
MKEKNEQGAQQTIEAGLNVSSDLIQIYELYAIGADSYSWHVLRRRRYKGGHQWIPILWFASLSNGCTHFGKG